MNVSDRLVRSGKFAERGRCLAIIDDTILGWSRLIDDAGLNADVTIESVLDSLLVARERIENEHPYQGQPG